MRPPRRGSVFHAPARRSPAARAAEPCARCGHPRGEHCWGSKQCRHTKTTRTYTPRRRQPHRTRRNAALRLPKDAMTLTVDQRWLLLRVGGWPMVDALASDEGTKRLGKSRSGYMGEALDGAPEWMRSYETEGGKIYSPSHPRTADCRVTVTMAQIAKHAATLPDALRVELVACRGAANAETIRVYSWCHCGGPETCMWRNDYLGPRHHPTEAEDEAHLAEYWRIRNWEDDLLERALGFECADEPVGQLELFEVA